MVELTDTTAQPNEDEDVRLVPDVVSVFPLPNTVLLPGELLPLHVFESRYRELTRDALAGHRVFGVVSILHGHEAEAAGAPPLDEVGCLGYIAQHTELPDGRFLLWLVGLEPFRIEQELDVETPYRAVRVSYLPTTDSAAELSQVNPLRRELRTLLPRPARRRRVDPADHVRAPRRGVTTRSWWPSPATRSRWGRNASSTCSNGRRWWPATAWFSRTSTRIWSGTPWTCPRTPAC